VNLLNIYRFFRFDKSRAITYNECAFLKSNQGGIRMRILKLSLVCCAALALVIGCASEKKMESEPSSTDVKMEPSQPASSTTGAATTTEAYQEVTLDVTGMT
jgi:hypothetical protein